MAYYLDWKNAQVFDNLGNGYYIAVKIRGADVAQRFLDYFYRQIAPSIKTEKMVGDLGLFIYVDNKLQATEIQAQCDDLLQTANDQFDAMVKTEQKARQLEADKSKERAAIASDIQEALRA